ncbi:MAG: C69 family dipeptidase [Bacteroidetes bacterium]|nr:C69 family dipeptidase [Bacteroidota bacterium]
MKKSKIILAAFMAVISVTGLYLQSNACTNVLVSRGASADGSVMISYLADAGGFIDPLKFYPGGTYQPGDSVEIYEWDTGKFLGKIAQVPRTYKVIGNMNEFQVVIGETTFTGREELGTPNGIMDYGSLKYIALKRAKTAREAIKIMTDLVAEYGYASTGESFSIADKNEAWVLELIGKGEFGKGAVWVAARVPEGYIAAHANQARIRKIDWKDKNNWMWSEDLVDFAKERGYFSGKKEDFSFVDAYNPLDPVSLLLCEGRVWSVYRRAAPSQKFSDDYWRCVVGAEPYPLFIKPDRLVTLEDMMAFVRDHFHDSPYYTAEGFAAGPHNNPYRWRPLVFGFDDVVDKDGEKMKFSWERTISQPQTGFSFVSQSRNWLPDEIGGIFWYGVDDTYSTCYMPLYMGMTKAPKSLTIIDINKFEWESAFWVFNLVANYAYGMYNYMIKDIQKVQSELETRSINMTKAIDQAALSLSKTNKGLMSEFLTDFSVNNAEFVVERWRELGYYLFTKYNDRYINEEGGIRPNPKGAGYNEEFKRKAVQERPGYYDVRWRQPGEPIK